MVGEGAIAWLQTCGYFHADRMPDNGDMMLPFKTWKSDLYETYMALNIKIYNRKHQIKLHILSAEKHFKIFGKQTLYIV